MCYASPVMLRGRCSCAISGLSTRPPAPAIPVSPLFPPCPERHSRRVHSRPSLSPLLPLHPRNSPVTPLFPLLTHKQGGRGYKEAKEMKEAKDVNEVEDHHLLLTHAFTTTLINIVGAPTFLRLQASARSQEQSLSEGTSFNVQLSTFNHFSPLAPIIPAHTQKQGGGGLVIKCAHL
jgi:hypothetical protein